MRLTSNKESVAKGEVSILAIAETFLAIILVFYLSAHFNTLRWLAIAMCVSPLLLLRTEESTRLGIKLFNSWIKRADESLKPMGNSALGDLAWVLIFIPMAGIGAVAVRLIATVVS